MEETQNTTMLDKVYIQAAKDAHKKFNYGDIITKEWLLIAFMMEEPKSGSKSDFDKYSFELMQNMSEFKDLMLFDYKKALANVRGIGYRIVTPKQQTKHAMDNLKAGVGREILKAVDLLTYVNENLLNNDEKRSREEAQMKVAAMMAFSIKRIP